MTNLTAKTVLVLNKRWQATEEIEPTKALCMIYAGIALGISTSPDGTVFESLGWDDWAKLSVRDGDRSVRTVHGEIRIPTVIMSKTYDEMRDVEVPFTPENVRAREGHKCFYTKKPLAPGEGDLDHMHPRARGGKRTWENMVYCEIGVNRKKGARTPREAGLHVSHKPTRPAPIPKFLTIKNTHGIPDWDRFLKKSASQQAV